MLLAKRSLLSQLSHTSFPRGRREILHIQGLSLPFRDYIFVENLPVPVGLAGDGIHDGQHRQLSHDQSLLAKITDAVSEAMVFAPFAVNKAVEAGNVEGHVTAVVEVWPFCFACGGVISARYR